jgi:hypothetical protein
MSIADFQRALCDLTLNPTLAAAVIGTGAGALSDYRLTPRERSRIIAVAGQPGMAVNCTLARANRFAPIVDAFPLTCWLLKPHLRMLLDELWSTHRPTDYQFAKEVDAFSAFVQSRLSQGTLKNPYAEDIFRYESAAWTLIQTLQVTHTGPAQDAMIQRSITVRFDHDPHRLVPPLERNQIPPPNIPRGNYLVRLTLRGDTLDVTTIDQGA